MRIASVLAAGALGLAGLTTAMPAATASPGFDIRSQNGGEFAGHAEAGGRIEWHGAKYFTIHVARVADICLSGGDGAGAYVWYQYRIGNSFTEWRWTDIADTTGCSDGKIDKGSYPIRSSQTVGAVRVIVRECSGREGCNTSPNDNGFSDWKWNPNR
ncbi:hypothetical protein [Kribbella sp. CA-294648]|uniref:hypothetical protein n=1 Tax=Kribbella sp. CA-294648 TaxID=3239948 RepID=UPI003D94537A